MYLARKFIGLMSGTSCDGVDAALVEITSQGLDMQVRYVEHCRLAYPDLLRQQLLKVMAPAKTRTQDIARLNVQVGLVFAECCSALMQDQGLSAKDISAVGSHGQTVCHMPHSEESDHGFTLQIGEASLIAARCGVTVVSDFRQADVAAGGAGAPLVPWTDYVLLRSAETTRIVQNIGGIANLTYLVAGERPEQLIAFDTGPGCMVIDELVRRASGKSQRYDPLGTFAARGEPDEFSVNQMLELPYFKQAPPKSAGREQFGRNFTNGMVTMMKSRELKKYDILATATLLTARSIAQAYKTHLHVADEPVEVVLCGGGARNKTLCGMLAAEMPHVKLRSIDEFGIPLQAKECVSFAMLAAACIDEVPANLPQVTGAGRQVVLGKISRV